MRSTIRLALALIALVAGAAISQPALADMTVTGTVGEIGVFTRDVNQQGVNYIRFNFTDANQTSTCIDSGQGAKYAWFSNADAYYREWYSMLLVSKKGATLTCALRGKEGGNVFCSVNSCTLN